MFSRALWMNFPSDDIALTVDRQFMVGDYLLVSPVLDEGATSVGAYFPEGDGYSFTDRNISLVSPAGGTSRSLPTPLTATNVHVLGGGILPLQQSALTTVAGRKTPFTLLVALSPDGLASGELFYDDGEQIDLDKNLVCVYSAVVGSSTGTVTGTVTESSYTEAASLDVESIVIMSVESIAPSPTVFFNGKALPSELIDISGYTMTVNLEGYLKVTDAFTLSW
jgi:alpha-glucosidase (family GH31 glycosyl hydrolase)